jgi:hypothetical protein
VRGILETWQQPAPVVLAGFLHSAYSTEAFRHRLFGRDERARVRELIGAEAERMVFAFCACPEGELVAAAQALNDPAKGAVQVSSRWDGKVPLARAELADLLVVHAANLAEQSCQPHGAPASWLARVSGWLAAAAPHATRRPLALDVATAPITDETERGVRRLHRSLLRAARAPARGAWERAGDDLRAMLAACPVGEPLVIAALLALAEGHAAEALELAARARQRLGAWGVAWDKRLRLSRWDEIARAIEADAGKGDRELEAAVRGAVRLVEAARGSPARLWAELDARVPEPDGARPRADAARPSPDADAAHLSPAADAARASPAAGVLPPRFSQYLAGLRTNAERPLLQFYPGLRAAPWHDPRDFPIVADLERLAPQIADEARAFDATRFQDEAEPIDRTGRWGVLFFLEMGRRNEENLARCPSLRWILEHHRTLTTHAGLMYLSSLAPHTHIAAHQGPTNLRVRCHLGLEVPAGCGIRVGGVEGGWEEGKCKVLDDSFTHEAWNNSDHRRLVLVLDLWHPDLTEDEVALLAGLQRYGATNQAGMAKYWAKNEEARRQAASRPAAPADLVAGATPKALERMIGEALHGGDLPLAAARAAAHAALCRPTRWYPVRRDDDPPLPTSVPWTPVMTPAKLAHDIDQLRYLEAHGILAGELGAVIQRYERLLDSLAPLGPSARVPLVGAALSEVGSVYNRIIHVRDTPRVPQALSRAWDPRDVEVQYARERPSVVVVDDFLAPDALESLRLFCLESTVWSANQYEYGRLGSFFREGFNCPLLIQIAEELRAAFPRMIGSRLPVTQIWGYKYAATQPSLPPHADFAAVNVNVWITPSEANLEPDAGGLVVYDVGAPPEWDFASYNRDGRKIRDFLASRGARPKHIPYRENRAIIMDSDLFHATPALRFKEGYENQRINVTFLFGDRHDE